MCGNEPLRSGDVGGWMLAHLAQRTAWFWVALSFFRSIPYTSAAVRATAIRFAHRSRRLTIRTVSETQKAAKATPKIARAMAMLGSYPRSRAVGKANSLISPECLKWRRKWDTDKGR